MTEHDLIGYIFMGTLGAFFLLGLPGFAIWRRFRPVGKPPEFGKSVGFGKVATWSIHPVDIVVAMGYIAMFVAGWKMTGRMEETETVRELDKWTVTGNTLIMLFFASVIPFVMYWRVRPVEFFGLNWPQWRWIFLIVPGFLMGVILLASIVWLAGWPDFVKENFGGGLQESVKAIRETNDIALIMLFFASVIPFVMYWRVRPVEFFGLNWPQWRWIFLIVPGFLMGVILLASIVWLAGWPDFVKENFGGGLQESVKAIRETNDIALIAAMISAAVIGAPIAEEIIFRGYLYPVAKKYTSQWFAVLFTGVLFGVVHMNLMGFPQLALIGILLAILYEITGSLWVPIFCHMAFNGMSMSLMLLSKFVPVP